MRSDEEDDEEEFEEDNEDDEVSTGVQAGTRPVEFLADCDLLGIGTRLTSKWNGRRR